MQCRNYQSKVKARSRYNNFAKIWEAKKALLQAIKFPRIIIPPITYDNEHHHRHQCFYHHHLNDCRSKYFSKFPMHMRNNEKVSQQR